LNTVYHERTHTITHARTQRQNSDLNYIFSKQINTLVTNKYTSSYISNTFSPRLWNCNSTNGRKQNYLSVKLNAFTVILLNNEW